MLASAEIGHRISKQVYAREEPKLREGLPNAQTIAERVQRELAQ